MSLVFSLIFLITGCGSGGGNPENKTGVLAPSSIAITPANTTVSKGSTTNFTATATYNDGSIVPITSGIIWETANTGIATIDSSTGAARGVAQGDTTVKATVSSVSSPPVNLHVTDAVISTINISTTTPTVPKGRAANFEAVATFTDGINGNVTGQVAWKSGDNTVVTMNSSIASSLKQGVATISASALVSGKTITSNELSLEVTPPALAILAISPSTSSLSVLGTRQFTASGLLTDSTPATLGMMNWIKDCTTGSVTIRSLGVATGVSSGACTITVNSGSITSNISSLTVRPGYLRGGAIQGSPLTLSTAVSTLAGSGALAAVDATGTAASFKGPRGITTDGTNLYVADTDNHKIRKIVIATGVVTTLAGSGLAGAFDAVGTAASFNRPMGITTDGSNLYVVENLNHTIRKIEIASGLVTTLAGSVAWGTTDGIGTSASFFYPMGITTDGSNLYVADTWNHKIRKIVISTGVVSTFAGSGTHDIFNAIGTAAAFYYPTDITTDGTNLYVTDSANRVIRKIIIATRDVSTLAGSGILGAGSVDGVGVNASFDYPSAITFDGSNLYVTEPFYNQIRKIEIASETVTTLAGTSGPGVVDAIGTTATFKLPVGITSDGSNLYVGDFGNNKIRKIQ